MSKVLSWKVPENVTEVKQFLGLCSYYRKYVKNFSQIAHPLFEITTRAPHAGANAWLWGA